MINIWWGQFLHRTKYSAHSIHEVCSDTSASPHRNCIRRQDVDLYRIGSTFERQKQPRYTLRGPFAFSFSVAYVVPHPYYNMGIFHQNGFQPTQLPHTPNCELARQQTIERLLFSYNGLSPGPCSRPPPTTDTDLGTSRSQWRSFNTQGWDRFKKLRKTLLNWWKRSALS